MLQVFCIWLQSYVRCSYTSFKGVLLRRTDNVGVNLRNFLCHTAVQHSFENDKRGISPRVLAIFKHYKKMQKIFLFFGKQPTAISDRMALADRTFQKALRWTPPCTCYAGVHKTPLSVDKRRSRKVILSFANATVSFIMARCPSPLVQFISGFLPQPNLVWRNPVFAVDTKTFIEGIVYYLEFLLPFHVTANRTRFRVHHTARNQTKRQAIENSKLKWEF